MLRDYAKVKSKFSSRFKPRPKFGFKLNWLGGWLARLKSWLLAIFLVILVIGGVVVMAWLSAGYLFPVKQTQNLVFYNQPASSEDFVNRAWFIQLDPPNKQIVVVPFEFKPGLTKADQLGFSLALNNIVDQVLVLPNAVELETRVQWQAFLQDQLKQQLYSVNDWSALIQFKQWLSWYFFAQKAHFSSLTTAAYQVDPQVGMDWQQIDIQLASHDLAYQQCPVAVVNTTDITGLASRFAGLLEQEGFLVIRITSEHQTAAQTQLQVAAAPEASCDLVNQQLVKLLPAADQLEVKEDILQLYRAKAVLILGEDLSHWLSH
ncbi:MAG: hypothetical protein GF390_04005 [Candidatus Pacebacteria bacterium]|nr:hypothetical protein [Candidatus Paceibacterota bacterium]